MALKLMKGILDKEEERQAEEIIAGLVEKYPLSVLYSEATEICAVGAVLMEKRITAQAVLESMDSEWKIEPKFDPKAYAIELFERARTHGTSPKGKLLKTSQPS